MKEDEKILINKIGHPSRLISTRLDSRERRLDKQLQSLQHVVKILQHRWDSVSFENFNKLIEWPE